LEGWRKHHETLIDVLMACPQPKDSVFIAVLSKYEFMEAKQMSIDKSHRLFTPTCDNCGETLDQYDDFYDALEAQKEAGWKSKMIEAGYWETYCTKCQERMNNA
jgi:Fe2+ or Zn2+ uptake regulation protein